MSERATSELRLEWKEDGCGDIWRAEVAGFRLGIQSAAYDFVWWVSTRVIEPHESHPAEGRASYLDAAKLAAESAALSLLIEALACFPVRDAFVDSVLRHHDETFGLCVEAYNLEQHPRAELLGRAILCAAVAVKAKEEK